MKQLLLITVTWYFTIVSGDFAGRVIGPFTDQKQCEKVRETFAQHHPPKHSLECEAKKR